MAEFVQTIMDWRRLCKAQEDGNRDVCDICPLGKETVGCVAIYEGDMDYAKVERVVTKWAEEHPEPVYQTWGEWFVEHGDLIEGWQNATNAAWMANKALDVFMKPIPADIAQKLGIEPKEE